MERKKTISVGRAVLSALPIAALLLLNSCSSYQHSHRVSNIAEENIVVTNKIAVDLKVDLAKTCRGRSGKHQSVKDAKDEAYYDAIQVNQVHVLVDPIYSIQTTRTLFGKRSSADVVGFAGYYKNSRSLKSIEDALKAEKLEKEKAALQAAIKNYKALANIGGLGTTTEVEKYRIDENCKPCTIYKTENKTKSTEEYFKFVSRLNY
jgi:hypothetical protein